MPSDSQTRVADYITMIALNKHENRNSCDTSIIITTAGVISLLTIHIMWEEPP